MVGTIMVLLLAMTGCQPDVPAPQFDDCPDPVDDDDSNGGDDDDSNDGDDDDSTPAPPVSGPPAAAELSVFPADAGAQDDLHCLVTQAAVDPDGDEVSYSFSWLSDGSGAGNTTNYVPAAATTFGQEWVCEVIPRDAEAHGPASSASVTIGANNSPPTAPGLIIEPANAEAGAALYCLIDQASEDADGDEVAYSYRWELNDVPSENHTSMVLGEMVLEGDCWTCVVVAYDRTSMGASVADSACIEAGAPEPPTQPVVEVALLGNGDLECSIIVGSESPGDPGAIITYQFSWTMNGIDTGIVIDLVEASQINPGELWTCSATPFDGVLFGPPGTDDIMTPQP